MTASAAPGPRGLPLIGNVIPFRRDVLRLLLESRERFGDVVRFRLGPMVVHLVAHPDLIRQVLQEREEHYDKETRSSSKIRGMTGLGLLTASGELWRRQRRLVQPSFQPAAVAGFVGRMTEAAEAMLERWERHAPPGNRPLDIASEMMRLTYAIVGGTLFSADVSGDAARAEEAMAVLLAHTYRRLQYLVDPPQWLPTPGNRRFRKARLTVDRVVYRILAERRGRAAAGEEEPGDLVSRLLRERYEPTGQGMTDEQLRNETLTLLLAGHETTANALTWTLYLLARHPEVLERVRDEAAAVFGGRSPEAADLCSLVFTERVLRESMRLYPPIWAMERRAVRDDELGGHPIPSGSTVVVSPWVTHRHPGFWEEPGRFDPERFTAERSDGRPALAYFPFGAGPRFCVGSHFAMTEALVITALVARRWRLRLVPNRPVVPMPGITLRARDGVWVMLEPW
ncbi:MAG TPA: cytochrome P450 [Thermoanaerobaculia bacterium]|nr:cytochrome P450 [Thermoanaerobaculia bacterium]